MTDEQIKSVKLIWKIIGESMLKNKKPTKDEMLIIMLHCKQMLEHEDIHA